MGRIKHHTIVVTGLGYPSDDVDQAHAKAHEIFGKYFKENVEDCGLVSDIITGVANCYCSFFVCPDGSKEGWQPSEDADLARKEFVEWLKEYGSCDFVEVSFGGDNNISEIINSGN